MKCIPINEAEAILEPFWDGGSSEHPEDKMSLLPEYEITIPDEAAASIEQTWCALRVKFQHGPPGSVITMSRSCDIDISRYDTFRVFASIPSHVRISVRGVVDGREIDIIVSTAGRDTNDEIDGSLSGSRLSGLSVAYEFTESRPVSMQVLWFGLANRTAQETMEGCSSPYTSDWAGCIYPEASLENDAFTPEIELLVGRDEMPELREALKTGPLSESYQLFLEHARGYLTSDPEADIGRYIPKPDRRWVRNRDMNRASTAGVMESLAFAGMIEQDYELSRMACRMALSAAHCEYWCESVIGTMPGTTWHHRSFTEEVYCRACALVLDWAGWALTPHSKQLIRDAIAMKGLPRIESDFKRMEYIRSMNQGIVFSSGRIFGTLALVPVFPRYSTVIDEAEKDLHEMIDNYVHPDGGTLEGMAYWAYTFSSAMPVFAALAKYRGQTLAEYATETLKKTAEYGLGMLSTTGKGTTYLPVNDSHQDASYPLVLTAAYLRLTGSEAWRELYDQTDSRSAVPDLYHLILAPRDRIVRSKSVLLDERFSSFPDVGQVSSVRRLADGSLCNFHFCSGPMDSGHYHQDKGSFIIEAGDEVLAMDRGVTNYHHPETNLMSMAARHNLVYPVVDGSIAVQGPDMEGGRLTWSTYRDDTLMLCSDNASAWSGGIFKKNYRRVLSPSPDLFIIDDELILAEAGSVCYIVNTRWSSDSLPEGVHIQGDEYELRFSAMSWSPVEVDIQTDGVDSHLEDVQVVRMTTGNAETHRLVTAAVLSKTNTEPSWAVSGNEIISTGDEQRKIVCDWSVTERLEVEVMNNKHSRRFSCTGGEWIG